MPRARGCTHLLAAVALRTGVLGAGRGSAFFAEAKDTTGWSQDANGNWVYTGGDGKADGGSGDASKGSTCSTDGPADGLAAWNAGGSAATHQCAQRPEGRRCWYLYRPASAAASEALVVDMHGFGGCAIDHAQMSQWKQVADSFGAIIAYPQALFLSGGSTWSAQGTAPEATDAKTTQDDIAFLKLLISSSLAAHSDVLDAERIYVAGYSNGCMMAQRFALEESSIVAAVGCQSAHLLYPPAGKPAGFLKVPFYQVHGNQDAVSPTAYSDALPNLRHWARYNGCPDADPTTTNMGQYIEHKYANCGSAEVVAGAPSRSVEAVLIELPGVGHMSYGAIQGLDTTQLVWRFVKDFRRAGAASQMLSSTTPGPSSASPSPTPSSSVLGSLPSTSPAVSASTSSVVSAAARAQLLQTAVVALACLASGSAPAWL